MSESGDEKSTRLPDGSLAPLDVLHAQAVPKEPVTLAPPLAFKDAISQTNLEPAPPKRAETTPVMKEGQTKLEVFKTNYRVLSEMDMLISRAVNETDKRVLRRIRHELDYAESIGQADEILKKAFEDDENIFGKRYKDIRFLLYQTSGLVFPTDSTPPVSIKSETNLAPEILDKPEDVVGPEEIHIESPEPVLIDTELPLNEIPAKDVSNAEPAGEVLLEKKVEDSEGFIVPLGLKDFIVELAVAGAPVHTLLVSLKDPKSAKDVKGYLDQAKFFNYLSDAEYKKALDLLGEVKSDAVKAESPESTSPPASNPEAVIPENLTTSIPSPQPLGPLTKEQSEAQETIDKELESARSEYATQLIAWKNENRKKKSKVAKLFSGLGFEKQVPEAEKPQELKDAEEAYIQAKKNKNKTLLSQTETRKKVVKKGGDDSLVVKLLDKVTGVEIDSGVTVEYQFNQALLDQVEKERDALKKTIDDESDPPLERGIIAKGFEKFAKMSPAKKIALSSILLGAGGFAFGSVGLVGATTYAGYRAARAGLGVLAGQGTGKILGKHFENKNKESREEILQEYSTGINEENFAEKERELMAAFEGEQNIEKRQRLYKALAMAGVAGATNIGLGLGQSYISPDSQDLGVLSNVKAKLGLSTETTAPSRPISSATVDKVAEAPKPPTTPDVAPVTPPVRVAGTDTYNTKIPTTMEKFAPNPSDQSAENVFSKKSIFSPKSGGVLESVADAPKAPVVPDGTDTITTEYEASLHSAKVAESGLDSSKTIVTPDATDNISTEYEASLQSAKMTMKAVAEMPETNVTLSPKGFLQDIHNLKAEIIKRYGADIPADIKANIMDKSSVDIAKQYGLYDPSKNLSAMGFKGEHLGIDSHGHLVYDHGGKVDVMFDENAGQVKTYTEVGGKKMFVPKPHVAPDTGEIHTEYEASLHSNQMTLEPTAPDTGGIHTEYEASLQGNQITSENIEPVAPNFIPGESVPLESMPSVGQPTEHIPYNGKSVDIMNVDMASGGGKAMMYEGTVIAHEQPFGSSKILVLDDKFQNGPQYKDIRGAFSTAFEKTTMADRIGKIQHSIDFEGGKIHVIRDIGDDPNLVAVLHNGKPIAAGMLTEKGSNVSLLDAPDIKGGWLITTVHEKAFKAVGKVIKGLKMSK